MIARLEAQLRSTVFVSDRDLATVVSLFQCMTLPKGQHLLRQGEVCQHIALVCNGCLRDYHVDALGREHISCFAEEGSWATNLESFFEGVPSHFSIQALERSELLLIGRPQVDHGFETLPAFREFFDLTSRKSLAAMQQLAVEKDEEPEARYRKLLEASPSLLRRVPQHYIASYLNIQPQSLSRIRRRVMGRREVLSS